MIETIYIPLLDEGVPVRRPAKAYRLPDGAYIILRPADYDPSVETWAFPPGTTVRCRVLPASDGPVLTAVEIVQEEQDRRVV